MKVKRSTSNPYLHFPGVILVHVGIESWVSWKHSR